MTQTFIEESCLFLRLHHNRRCPRCKVPRRAKKQLAIAKLPVVLLVHLKRFYFQGPFRNRIDTYVDFPTKWVFLLFLCCCINPVMLTFKRVDRSLDLTRYVPPHFRSHLKKIPRPTTTMGKPNGRQVGGGFAPNLPPKPDEYVYDLYAVSVSLCV